VCCNPFIGYGHNCQEGDLMKFIPHDYQRAIGEKIKAGNAFIICAMGGGKTAATLDAIKDAQSRILIIAPLRVAQHTWPAEIAKWENFQHLDYSVCTGALKKRLAALDANSKVTIINRENVDWLVTHYGAKWPFGVVIVDESSSFKNQSSRRFKALRKVRKLVKRFVLLTGTPAPNSPLELWPQAFLLDGGKRLDTAFTRFRETYFDSDYMGYNWTPKPGASEKITNAISDLCVVVEKYDGLPERVDIEYPVELPRKVLAACEAFEKEFLAELDGEAITAANAAVVAGKLAQVASGAVYDDEGIPVHVHDEKLDALEELLEASEGENVLVAYNYRHERGRIKERFPHAVDIKDDGAIDAWNRGEIKLLLAHPASAGHGLNLWEGGRRIIWFSPTWSNELKQQFDARLYRQGQQDNVFIHTIVATGTVDEKIVDAVLNKKSVQSIIIDRIKNL
jgi:hypothetical protein